MDLSPESGKRKAQTVGAAEPDLGTWDTQETAVRQQWEPRLLDRNP